MVMIAVLGKHKILGAVICIIVFNDAVKIANADQVCKCKYLLAAGPAQPVPALASVNEKP